MDPVPLLPENPGGGSCAPSTAPGVVERVDPALHDAHGAPDDPPPFHPRVSRSRFATTATSALSRPRHRVNPASNAATPASAQSRKPPTRSASASTSNTHSSSNSATHSSGDHPCVSTSRSHAGARCPPASHWSSSAAPGPTPSPAPHPDASLTAANATAALAALHPTPGERNAATTSAAAAGDPPSHPRTSAAIFALGATSHPNAPCSSPASAAAETGSQPPTMRFTGDGTGPIAGGSRRTTPPPPRPATPRRLARFTLPTALLLETRGYDVRESASGKSSAIDPDPSPSARRGEPSSRHPPSWTLRDPHRHPHRYPHRHLHRHPHRHLRRACARRRRRRSTRATRVLRRRRGDTPLADATPPPARPSRSRRPTGSGLRPRRRVRPRRARRRGGRIP